MSGSPSAARDPLSLRPAPPRVVIVGGGFGGLTLARALRRTPVRVTLVDRRNHHLFQPLLYQVATGELSPANIAAPLRSILERQRNVRVLMAHVAGFDVVRRRVLLARLDGGADDPRAAPPERSARDATPDAPQGPGNPDELPYDVLVVATGVRHTYFGHDEWEAYAPGLKSIEDATEIRARVLSAFEAAEREPDRGRQAELLTFVVVGAGPTGLELAGALAEIARHTLRHEFRAIDPAAARIILVEGRDRVLPTYPPDLSEKARGALARLGVQTRCGASVIAVGPDGVVLRAGSTTERIAARTVLWAAGVRASPLGRALAEATGAPLDPVGRLVVEPDLTLPGHPEILVIGDLAHFAHQSGGPLPGVAPVAMQQGRYVARLIRARLRGRGMPPFRYRNFGDMATIGRAAAVARIDGLHLSGYPAWLAWLFIHLIHLVEFQNKVLVLVQWAWNYATWNRAARLITGPRGDGRR